MQKRITIEINLPPASSREDAEKILDRIKDSCAIDPRKGATVEIKEHLVITTTNWPTVRV